MRLAFDRAQSADGFYRLVAGEVMPIEFAASRIVHAVLARFREPVLDPPEPWERPVTREVAARLGHGAAAHPFVPRRADDVPLGALDALRAACGARDLDQLFVIPENARPLGVGGQRHVATPTEVLGLGDQAVALWVDDSPQAGVRVAIPLDRLAAIDDMQFLLNARLTFLAPQRRLTIRYNAVARHGLVAPLAGVRAGTCGAPLPMPDSAPPPEMPYKWQRLSTSPVVRLAPDEPAVLRFGRLSAAHGIERSGLLALTPRELVIARDPDPRIRGATPYGHDALHVPRRRVQRARLADEGVRLSTGDIELTVALPSPLAIELIDLTTSAP